MAVVLLLGGVTLLALAVVALIRGKAWFIKSRSRAAAWLGVAMLVIVIGAIAAPKPAAAPADGVAAPIGQTPTQPVAKPVEPSKPNLEVVETSTVSEQFVRYVTGTVKNNSSKKYSYAQVEINLYDKDGNQVGSTLANVNNLEPGGTWKFKAPILEDAATSFKVKDVTGF